MGRHEVEANNTEKNKQYIVEELKKNAVTCINSQSKISILRRHLDSILSEEYVLVDALGMKKTIVGSTSSQKDKEKNIYGIHDIFYHPSYYGQPFVEVSRDMASHFKMYCLVNGVSDEEMLSLTEGAAKGPLKAKLLSLKGNFFKMIADKKMDEIEDFYVGIANYIEQKLSKFMNCDSADSLAKCEQDMRLISGTAAYLQQSIRLNGYKKRRPKQDIFINNVNKKLAYQGKKYTLQDIEKNIFAFDSYIAVLDNVHRDYQLEDNIDFDNFIAPESFGIDHPAIFSVATNSLSLLNFIKKTKKEIIEKGSDYNTTFGGNGFTNEFFVLKYKNAGTELYEDSLKEFRLPFDNHQQNFQYFKNEFGNDEKQTEAQLIKDIVRSISEIENGENAVKNNPNSKSSDYEKIADEYVNLKEICDNIINDDSNTFNDKEIDLAYRLKTFADKSLEDPKLGMIVAAKERYLETVKQEKVLEQKFQAIRKNLNSILSESFTHTDTKGVVRTISGMRNNQEEGTLGILDIFEDSTFKGEPLLEVSRNMNSHFKMYALVNGLTEEELVSLGDPEVKPELKNKLLDMKNDFFGMFIEKDLDKISDMYVKIFEMADKDKDRFLGLIPGDSKFIKDNPAFILKYAGAGSWYSQTLDYEGPKASTMGNKLVDMINQKLADKALGFTYNQAGFPIQAVDNVIDGLRLITEDDLNYKGMSHMKKAAFQLIGPNKWISAMQDMNMEFSAKHPDKNWMAGFPDNQHAQINKINGPDELDRDVFLERAFLYDKNSSFGEELRKKTEPFKSYAAASKEILLDKYPEIKGLSKKTVASLENVIARTKERFKDGGEALTKKAITGYMAAKKIMAHPDLIKDGQQFSEIVNTIDADDALEAYSLLDSDDVKKIVDDDDPKVFEKFVKMYEDQHAYNLERNSKKYQDAVIDEEERAMAAYDSKPARDIYVSQQKILGSLLERRMSNPDKAAAMNNQFKQCLSFMIAAKQTETFIKDKYKDLTEDQIKSFASNKFIKDRAEYIARSDGFADLSKKYMKTENCKNLAIGVEHLFNKNEKPIMATTEVSEKAINDLVGDLEKKNCVKEIEVSDLKTMNISGPSV